MIPAISNRRSIRKYKTTPVPQAFIEEIIKARTLAPSSKNRQPWKFVIATGTSKEDMLSVMKAGLEREKSNPLLPESANFLEGAEYTFHIMQQAPVVIFILNSLGVALNLPLTTEERISEMCR